MTEQTTQKRTIGTTADEQLDRDIEILDKEAKEALDRLADKRVELERRHRATELAAQRQREREQERRLADEQREAQERARRRAVEEAERLRSERLALEERAEEEAKALAATLAELVALDPAHRRAVEAAYGNAPQQLFGRIFSQELRDWFGGRFKAVVPGMSGGLREGLRSCRSATR